MAILQWDKVTEKLYETGTDKAVLFVGLDVGGYDTGVAWNGVIAIPQSPDGAEPEDLYANNRKYLTMRSAEEFKGTIRAYTYPDEFAECDGSKEVTAGVYLGQQDRKPFGIAYRTLIGNDTQGTDYGYKIHVIYGATAVPSSREYETVNADPTAIEFSWDFETVPEYVEKAGYKPTAYVSIDSTKVDPAKLKALEDTLYGTADTEPELPGINELIALVEGV